jgi:hypothetical protein
LCLGGLLFCSSLISFCDSANGGATKLPTAGVPDDDLRQTFSDWVANVKETSADSAGSGNSTSSTVTASSASGKPTPVGAIAGVAIGGVVAVAAIALFFILWHRKKKATETEKCTVPDDPYSIQELDSG